MSDIIIVIEEEGPDIVIIADEVETSVEAPSNTSSVPIVI